MKLFAYGTLMRRGRVEALVGRRLPEPEAATLHGYQRIESSLGYPVIVAVPRARVAGLLWEIGDADLSFADHYEGFDADPPTYIRQSVTVDVAGMDVPAEAYVGNPVMFKARGAHRSGPLPQVRERGDTELRQSFLQAMRAKLQENPDELDPRKVLGPGREAMVERVRQNTRFFALSGRA